MNENTYTTVSTPTTYHGAVSDGSSVRAGTAVAASARDTPRIIALLCRAVQQAPALALETRHNSGPPLLIDRIYMAELYG